MTTYTLELELVDTAPLRTWFGDQVLEPGARATTSPPGTTIDLTHMEAGSGFLESVTVTVVVSVVTSVAVNVLSNALYDVLKGSIRRLRVNDVAVRPTEESLSEEMAKAAADAPAPPTASEAPPGASNDGS